MTKFICFISDWKFMALTSDHKVHYIFQQIRSMKQLICGQRKLLLHQLNLTCTDCQTNTFSMFLVYVKWIYSFPIALSRPSFNQFECRI